MWDKGVFQILPSNSLFKELLFLTSSFLRTFAGFLADNTIICCFLLKKITNVLIVHTVWFKDLTLPTKAIFLNFGLNKTYLMSFIIICFCRGMQAREHEDSLCGMPC